ncbi:hypothetical protein SteCoe_19890 [Stentor coeruleus]|uniref:C2 domain-containing protein n=1 Tax=Stentor coeruleus TaxID=5963 RepID=A0A1R2BT27_9CILI|nr:hypothetical protein SteCoe_19890 [Stentor coeruleus]
MGECASRPSSQEIEQHIIEINSKNDMHFRYAPMHTITKDQLLAEKNLHILESKAKLFKKKKQEFISKLESTSHGVAVVPELNIEVQKGVNLIESGLCWAQGKPYVVVSLEPNGPKLETFDSNTYRPYWFKFIQFKQTIPYAKIVFRVMSRKNYGSDDLIGVYEIKISEISDQMVKEGWFSIETEYKNNPAIRVRVQYIYDEKKLLQSIIDNCGEKIQEIQRVIQRIHDASHNSS